MRKLQWSSHSWVTSLPSNDILMPRETNNQRRSNSHLSSPVQLKRPLFERRLLTYMQSRRHPERLAIVRQMKTNALKTFFFNQIAQLEEQFNVVHEHQAAVLPTIIIQIAPYISAMPVPWGEISASVYRQKRLTTAHRRFSDCLWERYSSLGRCMFSFRWLKNEYYAFCVLKRYTLKSVSVSGRPAVNTITPEIMTSQPSNFLHSIVTSISRSSSKMSRIRSEFSDFR